jgi:DNA-binding GntR family transcriptional regulator
MTKPLAPEGIDELALIYAQEYRLPVDRVKGLIEACERFGPSPKTLAVALALLSQHVTITTISKAGTHANEAVAQQPERFRS